MGAVLVGSALAVAAAGCGGGGMDARVAIERAVRSYVSTSGCCQFAAVSVERVRISRVNGAYATASVDGFARPQAPAGTLTAVLGDAGASGWVVINLGTVPATLGCNVPASVANELGLACGVPA